MPSFGKKSLAILGTCDNRLREICHAAIKTSDFTVLSGYRDEKEQNKLFKGGHSKLKFPDSKHNQSPSIAVDIAPWPIDWDDLNRFFFLSGLMFGTAERLGYSLRWGGDWDGDHQYKDQKFYDLPHFELIDI